VWCSPAFLSTHGGELDDWAAALSRAPDLCVEVRSPSNPDQHVGYGELQERIALFLATGAREAWILHPTDRVDCFGAEGLLTASRIVPDFLAIAGVVRSQALTHGAFQTLDHPLDFLVREVVVEGQCQGAAG